MDEIGGLLGVLGGCRWTLAEGTFLRGVLETSLSHTEPGVENIFKGKKLFL